MCRLTMGDGEASLKGICLLHWIITLFTIYIEAHTYCETSGTVCNGSRAVIKCNFTEDLNVTKRDFSVQMYGVNVSSGHPEIPLDCYWPKKQPDTPKCIVKPGYKFDYSISSELELEIPAATAEHEGRYVCQRVPMEWRHPYPCTLRLYDASAKGCEHHNDDDDDDDVDANDRDEDNGDNGELSGTSTAGVVLGVTFAIVITIAVVFLFLVFSLRRRRASKHSGSGHDSSPEQDPADTPLQSIPT